MKVLSKAILIVLIILYCYLGVHFRLWEPFFNRSNISDMILASAGIIILAGLVASAIALIIGRKKARKWFIFFNLPYLALGLYLMHFNWNFWLFKTPTLMDRIKASTPSFLVGVALPIAVIIYYIKWEKK